MFTRTKHFNFRDYSVYHENKEEWCVYNHNNELLGFIYFSDERNDYYYTTSPDESATYNLEQLKELTGFISDLTNRKYKRDIKKPKKEIDSSTTNNKDDRSLEAWSNIIMGKKKK